MIWCPECIYYKCESSWKAECSKGKNLPKDLQDVCNEFKQI